jgi:hypothetical protein
MRCHGVAQRATSCLCTRFSAGTAHAAAHHVNVLLFAVVVLVALGLLWQLQRLLAYSADNRTPVTWRELAMAAGLLASSIGLMAYLTR